MTTGTLTYTATWRVLWGAKASHKYLMTRALELARRMRIRGHNVTVVRI